MRQCIADAYPDARGMLLVSGKKARHLVSVLRLTCGDMLYVRLPNGELQQMTVAHIDSSKKQVSLQVAGKNYTQNKALTTDALNEAPPRTKMPETELWLFQFVAKPQKMDLIVRQATECGVHTIIPVVGAFCQNGAIDSAKKKVGGTDERWFRIITEAREQSGSPVNTRIGLCLTVPQAMELWQKEVKNGGKSLSVVLYEQDSANLSLHAAVAQAGFPLRRAAVMVGSEGGIAPEEIDFVQKFGFKAVHFATNILRCETAALYGLAAVQNAVTENTVWQFKE